MSSTDDRPSINLILDAGTRGQRPAKLQPDSNRQQSRVLYETALKRWLCFPPDLSGLLLWSGSCVTVGGLLGGILAVLPSHPAYLLPVVCPAGLVIAITANAAASESGHNPYLAPWSLAMVLFCLGLWLGVSR